MDAQKKWRRPSQQQRDDVKAERVAFAEALSDIDASRLVFVDESGVRLGMRTTYGYAPRGQPCVEFAPYRKGRRVSLLGYMSASGGGVTALTGTVGRAEFERFVMDDLAPSLKTGDIVVWDNHTIHKSAIAREAVEARGAILLRQPRYSPECNAAELLWAKIKRLAREAAADTVDALHTAMMQACAAVSVSDLEGWIRHTTRLNPLA